VNQQQVEGSNNLDGRGNRGRWVDGTVSQDPRCLWVGVAVRLDSHHQRFVTLSRTGYVPISIIPTDCRTNSSPDFHQEATPP
jgi:hypothetical protein